MSVMRGGRVFEKVGVNVSEVYGTLGAAAQKAMAARGVPGMADDPRFWASGISLVAHMQNPHVPAVHMNTRMFWTPACLVVRRRVGPEPVHRICRGHGAFPRPQKAHLDPPWRHALPELKAWADEYFYVPHRGRARGVGGIFMDDRNSGDWEADFALTQDIGRAFLPAFVPLVESAACSPGPRPTRTRSWFIAGSMPNTIWSMTAAPNSGWRRGMTRMRC
jgi:coproporphyrinogen III oxidase